MMKTERPLWGRGIMVSPQHFQQQAAYAAWTAEVIARMGLNHPWGVVEATFEPEMLKLGRLQAHRLQVRFQDGTMIDTDNADALPSALSLDGASGEAVIVLALPLMQANGGNCLKPEEVAERPARFRQRWRDVRNQFGDDTRQIAVIQPELTLRFAHQDNSDYLTCPLVRLQRDSQGAWLIDETFLPPLLQIQGSRWLATQLEQLLVQLRARLTRLMAMRRESNERMNTLAWQGQAGQQREGLSDSLIKSAKDLVGGKDKPVIDQSAAGPQGPLDDTFGPLLQLMGKNTGSNVMSADSTLSLQTYLTRITRVRLRLQQVANASDPQEMMQVLAQTVFQGKSVDLTDTQQYGSLISASLGEEWSGFGNTLFVQPLTQAWETVLLPSAASLNDKWRRSVVANWHTAFDGRFPFAASKSDASLPMLAEFVRKDSGRIERFLTTELNGVLHKEGSQWVPDKVNSHGLVFNPAFLRAINQLSQLSDILFTDGSQGISFELQARPAPEVVETQLTIDGQKLRYFNQMADWQTFRWPGETYKPGTLLTWTTVNAGTRLFGDYSGTWGFIRWLEQGKRHPLDRSQWMMSFSAPDGRTLQWVLRSQLGSGPLALLALRGLTLPDQIFTVDAAESAQALTTGVGNSDMDEMEL